LSHQRISFQMSADENLVFKGINGFSIQINPLL